MNLSQKTMGATTALVFAAIALGLIFAMWVWYGWRIEPSSGELALLIHKTGKDLPADAILAPDASYKGVQLEVLPEGRYFRNPYSWGWRLVKAVDIPAGKFGVLIRKYGKDLPGGEILAPDDSYKGIVREVLGTGKHRINPVAYDVKLFNDITIKPGHVGVITSLCGDDSLTAPPAKQGFLVTPERKGVLPEVLKEGTHRLNPYRYAVSIVNVQSQRFELSGDDAISFLTLDGFTVKAEGTLEFNLEIDKVALLTQEVGEMDDILQKIILPSARGFSRIEGSKKYATEFIVGESRQAFQNSLQAYLKSICAPWGISLNSVLIRDIYAPQKIASIIRDRELAVQDGKKIDQQLIQAQSQAELERQNALAEQKSSKVIAETNQIQQRIAAQQRQTEQTIAAQTDRDLAATQLQAAQAQATAQLTQAEAERSVVQKRTEALAAVLKQEVSVYAKESDYVRSKLYEKAGPAIQSLLTNDDNQAPFGLPYKPTEASKEGANK